MTGMEPKISDAIAVVTASRPDTWGDEDAADRARALVDSLLTDLDAADLRALVRLVANVAAVLGHQLEQQTGVDFVEGLGALNYGDTDDGPGED